MVVSGSLTHWLCCLSLLRVLRTYLCGICGCTVHAPCWVCTVLVRDAILSSASPCDDVALGVS